MQHTTEPSREKRQVECAKCGRTELAGTNLCSGCGARLYICCHHCGHSNERIAVQCRECGRRLHRSVWKRLRKRLFGGQTRITPLQVVLLIVFVVLAYKVIVYLAEFQTPAFTAG